MKMAEPTIAAVAPNGRLCTPEDQGSAGLELGSAEDSRQLNAMWVIALLVCLNSILAGLSVDLILPAFPGIRQEFSLDAVAVQQTLTCYLVAYAFGSLVIGPISDAFGRRPVLLFGLGIFVVGSLVSFFTDSFVVLLLCRCIQGMGASAGKVVCRALVADRFDPVRAQKVLSVVTAMFLAAPALGPVLGGWLHANYGWRSNFLFMSLLSLVTLILYICLLRETHVAAGPAALQFGRMGRGFAALARHRSFVLISMISGICSAPMFLYVTSAPTVVLNHWGLGASGYVWLSVPMVVGTFIGSMVCNRLSARVERTRLATWALFSQVGFAVLSVLVTSIAPEGYDRLVMLPVAMTAAASATAFPILMLTSLDCAPTARGLASSLFNFISLGLVSVVGGFVAPLAASSAQLLAIVATSFAMAALAAWLVLQRIENAAHAVSRTCLSDQSTRLRRSTP